ncbi:hypothetical protein FKM82_000355 [Ascaphus truei]
MQPSRGRAAGIWSGLICLLLHLHRQYFFLLLNDWVLPFLYNSYMSPLLGIFVVGVWDAGFTGSHYIQRMNSLPLMVVCVSTCCSSDAYLGCLIFVVICCIYCNVGLCRQTSDADSLCSCI